MSRNCRILRKRIIFLPIFIFLIAIYLFTNSTTTDSTTNHSVPVYSKVYFNKPEVELEAQDEFISVVLAEIPFEEINLNEERSTNLYSEFDTEILEDQAKIIPGLGEYGEAIKLQEIFTPSQIEEMEKSQSIEGYNVHLSQMISPNRQLDDSRHKACRNISYDLTNLPSLSIIIVFFNEPLTTLARTLHSIVQNTPGVLLREIILVDDHNNYNSYEELINGKLERYLVTQFPVDKPRIRLVRLKKRAGLIRARMIGAHVAQGDVLFFCDAHMEVEEKWAEPLLERIRGDQTRLVWPAMSMIHPDNFRYDAHGYFFISGFHWNSWFIWINIPEYELSRRQNSWSPTRSPTMMGAAFAIDRRYFWSIGSFDPLMKVWGGENLELPIRIWLCGGSVEVVPCSRIGHLFRTKHTYNFTFPNEKNAEINSLPYNSARFARVWMDEYQKLFFRNYPDWEKSDIGDISARQALRHRLKCKNFQWYLDNIYKEKFQADFVAKSIGQFASPKSENGSEKFCLNSEIGNFNMAQKTGLWLNKCTTYQFNEDQIFYFMDENVIRIFDEGCLSVDTTKGYVEIQKCSNFDYHSRDKWNYNEITGQLIHLKSQKCVSIVKNVFIMLEECIDEIPEQQWQFIKIE